jgi:hypothetical protein
MVLIFMSRLARLLQEINGGEAPLEDLQNWTEVSLFVLQ